MPNRYGAGGEPLSFVNMFPTPLHIVLSPLTTAFYNLVALTAILPALETEAPAKGGSGHHLYQSTDWKTHAANASSQAKSPLLKAERPDVVQVRE